MTIPKELEARYRKELTRFQKESSDREIFEEPAFDLGNHPENFVDSECGFAAGHIYRLQPEEILDIGSYRHFILGLLAHVRVTTLDVRLRKSIMANETVITGDARRLAFSDRSFDVVLSLCALEHFGLGRYGDAIDGRADEKAMAEMMRVLRPGGVLIFSTTITRAHPSIAFNAHRIYNRAGIHALCADLICTEEKYYSHRKKDFCAAGEITSAPREWDVYCGCWKKAAIDDQGT